jgi:ABC-2 type transport system permease protein
MNAATETSESFAAPATAPRPVRPFYWSVRRELWENRSLVIAPLVAGALVPVALLLRAMHLSADVQILSTFTPERQQQIVTGMVGGIAILITWVTAITAFFYLLDALQGERKDRSVLFWKSMPVSDTTTVLSKLFTGLVVAAGIVVAVSIATQLVVLLLASVILMVSGASAAPIWSNLQWFPLIIALIYGQIALALWYSPVAAWLLFVSAWAKRSPILWATLTPIAIMLFERVAIGTRYVQDMLAYRLRDAMRVVFVPSSDAVARFNIDDEGMSTAELPQRVFELMDPLGFLTNPWLWVGLVVAAGLVAAAIWMRRYREPI